MTDHLGLFGEWQRYPICIGSGRLRDTLMPTQTVVCHAGNDRPPAIEDASQAARWRGR